MAETSNPQASRPQPPEEFHWAVSYLREDIQDMRNEIRGTNSRIDELNRSLSGRIDETNRSLNGCIDETNQRIDEKYELLTRRLDNRFALMMTTMVALAGVMVAVIKL